MKKLNEEEIKQHLSAVEGWKRTDEKWIQKKYRFKAFLTGIQFVHEVAELAEKRFNHHPFISIDYKLITLRMSTWNAGGLTDLDFTAAQAFDDAYERVRES